MMGTGEFSTVHRLQAADLFKLMRCLPFLKYLQNDFDYSHEIYIYIKPNN